MAIKGIIATKEITPKESEFEPLQLAAPNVKESIKVEVNGPEATPPESNAIAEKSEGLKIIKIIASKYPGIKMSFKSKPITARNNANPIAIAVPIERNKSKTFLLIVPPETCSTCSLKTQTAGSAQTMIEPKIKPTITKITYQMKPFEIAKTPSCCPNAAPA